MISLIGSGFDIDTGGNSRQVAVFRAPLEIAVERSFARGKWHLVELSFIS
ncbi:hypothetical protein [Paraburkholderia sp. BCC1885]|nr:hypothetical protein [Paraburkholderia sp. BCC1885]